MDYLDTSVLVAALTNEESGTADAFRYLEDAPEGSIAISSWVITEFSSALSLKVRTKQIRTDERTKSLAAFRNLVEDVFVIIPITTAHFQAAARLADRHLLGLKGGDALHLVIAMEQGLTLRTFDRRLLNAGETLDTPVHMP